jgi:hypothetical protein
MSDVTLASLETPSWRVLEYRKEGPEAVVMSAFGRDADWFRNIEANPNSEVIIGSQRFIAVHRLLDEDEAVSVITGYELRNWLIAPIVRWVLSRLLGWRYDGEMDQRRRLIAQLPCIAFHPATMLGGPAQPPIRSFGLQSAGAGGAALWGEPVAGQRCVRNRRINHRLRTD